MSNENLKSLTLEYLALTEEMEFLADIAHDLIHEEITKEEAASKLLEAALDKTERLSVICREVKEESSPTSKVRELPRT